MTLREVEHRYPSMVSDYFRALAKHVGEPIARQCFPDIRELDPGFEDDGLGEIPQSAVPRLIHRYPHHALLLVTDHCATRCRFCFRKRLWHQPVGEITDSEFADALEYLKATPSVREILISGGDPLTLPLERLSLILKSLSAVPSIRMLRLGTRLPMTDPQQITPDLAGVLARHEVRLMLHINHPAELTDDVRNVIAMLRRAGILLFNQSVLLKGINDDPDTLETLFLALAELGIHPHYLFHIDPVAGVSHFATGLREAHGIMSNLRRRLSSLLLPALAIDLPAGKGKILISPDTPLPEDLTFTSPLTGERVRYPFE